MANNNFLFLCITFLCILTYLNAFFSLFFILSYYRALLFAKIFRGENSFKANFTVVNSGRLEGSQLVYFENEQFPDCLYNCIKHLLCETVNYNSATGECELNSELFDKDESTYQPNWRNYGTPQVSIL